MRESKARGAARRAMAAAAAAALLAPGQALAGSAGDAPSRPPSFASAVAMVKIDVSVTDAQERRLAGLAAGDFKVFEDGVPQQLTVFSQERLPISLAVVIDCSGSMGIALPSVKAAARRLLGTLEAADQAQVVQFNERLAVLQDFTSDVALLQAAVGRIEAGGQTGLYNALYLTLKDPRLRRRPHELTRQAVVVLSDGADTSSLVDDDQVLDLARRGDAIVFTVSLSKPWPSRADAEERNRATFFLTALARETGGRAFFAARLADLDGVYDGIANELRTQYALGYVPSNQAVDGRYRRIAVQLLQASGRLRHRTGYYSPRPR
jgi:Ca-activated chloride channel homolog